MTCIPGLPHPSPIPVPVCFFCAKTRTQAAALIGHGSKWICDICLGKCGRALWPDDGDPVSGDFDVVFREMVVA